MKNRRLPIGAEAQRDGGVHFRVWAPGHKAEVVADGRATPLSSEPGGYHSGLVAEARVGSRYQYRIDGRGTFADPASRLQPEGPHGPSEVVDPSAYRWRDGAWRGATPRGQVAYEMHIGTFTKEGTLAAATRDLPRLAQLGITLLEVMPVAEFPGTFGWGYDGVNLFAPYHGYGVPDDLRRFVDEAHGLGMSVILDVVYNHVGPDGCYLREFSGSYFTDRYENEWGEALNFDGDGLQAVREFFVSNAGYWIDEFHFDGLRLDATQSIHDASPTHVLVEIADRARQAAQGRTVVLVAENECQHAQLVRPVDRGGYGLDALWNDDFHHAAVTAATGDGEAYYSDTAGTPQQLVSAVKWGYLFQGQRYAWQKKGRGTPALDLPSSAFVNFLENHDQVANSLRGVRLWKRTAPGVHRALVALTLLAPQTPMLFQGEEFGSSAPFLFFADHKPELAVKVREGRAGFLSQFPSITGEAARAQLIDPASREAFTRCKLDPADRARNAHVEALYRDLLRLRRDDPAFRQQDGRRIHGTVLAERAFALRFLCDEGDRLVVVNLGPTLRLASIADSARRASFRRSLAHPLVERGRRVRRRRGGPHRRRRRLADRAARGGRPRARHDDRSGFCEGGNSMSGVVSVVRMGWRRGQPADALVSREWMVPNGLGGYASGTLGGVSTRRFHGLLVAALGESHGRTMILNRLDAELVFADGSRALLDGSEPLEGARTLPEALAEVRFEDGLPIWQFETHGAVVEKRIILPHGRNTTVVVWHVLSSPSPVTLRLRPALHVRPHEGSVSEGAGGAYPAVARDQGCDLEPGHGMPTIALRFSGAAVRQKLAGSVTPELVYAIEKGRGYDCHGPLYSPGVFELDLASGSQVAVVVTVETADRGLADVAQAVLGREQSRRQELIAAADVRAREGVGAELVLAADAFIVRPAEGEVEGTRPASIERTVIAGYPWFTDWGRDTMISLEGLALLTGRRAEAAHILERFAHHVKGGLIPNLFPEGTSHGLYHTADATLWFFHALERYVATTGDREILRQLLPTMLDIVHHHVEGTAFGIHVDPSDDLLTQGAEGYQLTWMDAKVGDWVVTPRRGKAVEINALWFNALKVLAQWLEAEGRTEEAAPLVARATRAQASFNRRFWFERGGHLYDVVDGPDGKDDPSLRPNQIFAVALQHPVLEPARWERVVEVVRASLLTPVGLRSLGPQEPSYQKRYDGDLRARDAAYHQGTVWGWLTGPFVDAWLRVHPTDVSGARQLVEQVAPHLGEACIGTISEIFDAEVPFAPRGCVAQAWSVAEVLRVWVRTAPT